jgi:Recombination endonuclease VII
VARKARPWWNCKCGFRNERLKRKCLSCGKARPKKRVPAHAKTLRDDAYEHYVEVAEALHAVYDERCCVCGKPRGERRHDRDHDHLTGHPRGLACVRCNRSMPHWMTVELATNIARYLYRAQYYPLKFTPNSQLDTQQFTKPEDDVDTESTEG